MAVASFAYPPWGSAATTQAALELASAAEAVDAAGAQRAVTTFLHTYLRSHPEALEPFREIALRVLTRAVDELDRHGHDSYDWGGLARAYAPRAPIEIARGDLGRRYIAALADRAKGTPYAGAAKQAVEGRWEEVHLAMQAAAGQTSPDAEALRGLRIKVRPH